MSNSKTIPVPMQKLHGQPNVAWTLFFSIIASYTTHANAADVGEISHTFSINYETYQQSVYSNFRDREFEFTFDPAGLNLGYGLSIGENWSANLSYQNYEDDYRQNTIRGNFENTTFTSQLGYASAPWWFGLSYSRESEQALLNIQREDRPNINETTDYTSAAIEAIYSIDMDALWLDIGLSTEYQTQDTETIQIIFAEQGDIGEHTNIDSDGWLATLAFSASYLIEINDSTALLPSAAISWSENLSGTTHGSTRSGIRQPGGRFQRIGETDFSANNSEGSGQINFAASLFLNKFAIHAGIALPFDEDFDTETMDDGKRIYIGTSVAF